MMEFYGRGSAQSGYRPGIVVQNNIGNQKSPNVVAVPLTTAMKNISQPTHVLLLSKDTGLKEDSLALCESPMSVPKENLGRFIASLSKYHMRDIAKAFLLEHPVLCFLDQQEIFEIQTEAFSLIAD